MFFHRLNCFTCFQAISMKFLTFRFVLCFLLNCIFFSSFFPLFKLTCNTHTSNINLKIFNFIFSYDFEYIRNCDKISVSHSIFAILLRILFVKSAKWRVFISLNRFVKAFLLSFAFFRTLLPFVCNSTSLISAAIKKALQTGVTMTVLPECLANKNALW